MRSDLCIGLGVVGDVVDEDFNRLAVFKAFDEITDAGFASVVRRKRGGVGQAGFDDLQWHDL